MTDVVLCGLCGDEQRQDIAPICTQCSASLNGDLRAVRSRLALLRDAAARLTRLDRPAGRNDDDIRRTLDQQYPLTAAASPSPVDFGAVAATDHLVRTVRHWAQQLEADSTYQRPYLRGETRPEVLAVVEARWLADRWRIIRTRTWAPDCAAAISAAVRRAEQHVDQPPVEHYAGHCDAEIRTTAGIVRCGWELYAQLGKDVVKCRGCGTEHDVAMRRQKMLESAGNTLVTATQATRALSTPDREVTAAMVRGWKHRGGLEQAIEHGQDGGQRPAYDERGRPLYVLRDVMAADQRIRYGTTSTGKAS